MTDAERQAALEAIAREVADCTRCRLHAGRTRAVPGEGSADTEVVFVGEGPGEQEDRQGRPFVGASGQLLTELIESLGWRRSDVFITNVVKCRPPGNRDPQPDEIAACATFLRRQLAALDPAVVVTVGKHSLNAFRPGERIGRVHGTTAPADPSTGASNALVFSMYHPAFALYQGSNRATLVEDMAGLPGALLASRARREAAEVAAGARVAAAAPVVAVAAAGAGTTDPAAETMDEATGTTDVAADATHEATDVATGTADAAADATDETGTVDVAAGEVDAGPPPDPDTTTNGRATDALALPITSELADPTGQLTLF